MKIYVKQMQNWNCYAYCAEDVEEQYWNFFREEMWWQLGNNFIKTYDNVKDFHYCAENFAKYGDTFIRQQMKLLPVNWEKALDLFIAEMKDLDIPWYIHGSTAMALWGIDVVPKDINIIIPNASDFDKFRDHFCKLAIMPIERCDNWVMSALGSLYLEGPVGIAFHNRELEPYDMGSLKKVIYKGEEVYVSTLEMLKQDNENYNRPERVALIEERMKELG